MLTTSHRAPALALVLALLFHARENLIRDGDGSSPGQWVQNGPAGIFALDGDVGAQAEGSFSIHKREDPDRAPSNWLRRVDLGKKAPKRLKLTAHVRAAEFAPGTEACAMIQVWSAKNEALAYAWADKVVANGEFRATKAVFDVPEGAERVHVLMYLVGAGRVWFDDVVLEETDEPVTPPPASPPVDSEAERLARECAADLPWLFDGDAARERAAKERKPVLLYVRCTDEEKSFGDAETSIEAAGIPIQEDGYAKDLLFRAGPLSTPEIRDLVARRTVPVCVTYNLGKARFETAKLAGFDVEAGDLTTPALVLCSARGEPLAKLHRIGTLSDDFVDRWLREALDEHGSKSGAKEPGELYRDGELARVLTATASAKGAEEKLLRARTLIRLGKLDEAEKLARSLSSGEASAAQGLIELRRGDWDSARRELDRAANELAGEAGDDARFWSAWCAAMLGDHAAAIARWSELVGPTRVGRRAAACTLPRGPRPYLAVSTRAWPGWKELPEQTEALAGFELDLARSATALLELQRDDGSFGDHAGLEGLGYVDPAITAIAAQTLLRCRGKLPGPLAKRAAAAYDRAVAYLRGYAGSENPAFRALDPFNLAYATHALLEAGEKDAAKSLVARMAKLQLADGNWTVYNPERPASFNTALCILALEAAKSARIELPAGVLERGLDALEAMRQPGDRFPYSTAPGHDWMTTDHGSIARDALCEHALLACGRGSKALLDKALDRFLEHHAELRVPTKRYYDYFNERGHGGYYFFFAHRNAQEAAAAFGSKDARKKVRAAVQDAVLAAQEGDGTWMDKFLLGRAYGTAMALYLLQAP
jgi:hypothetical protein